MTDRIKLVNQGGATSIHIGAGIEANGDLRISGQDLGEAPSEIYGDMDHTPDVSGLSRVKPETMMPSFDAHQPTEVFGGSPAFEVDRNSIRPTNPRLLSSGAPQVNVPRTEQRIPIRERPVIPASTQPMISNSWAKNLAPAKKIRMEAERVAPPVRNSDMKGLSTSFGTGNGRMFGADAHLRTPF